MEKRNDLYHNAIMMAQSRNRLTSAIGKTIYYTFSHEQDVMVHQFYGFLLQNKGILGFNEALRHSEYANAVNALKEALDLKGDAAEVIKQTGLSVKQWKMRVHFGYKRFKQKMYNVYLRWFQEREKKYFTNESKNIEIEWQFMAKEITFMGKFLKEGGLFRRSGKCLWRQKRLLRR